MKRRLVLRLICVSLASCCMGSSALCQGLTLEMGDRVRISIANLENTQQWHVGQLSSLDEKSITIIRDDRKRQSLTLPVREVDGFQRSLGRDTERGLRWIGGGAAFGFTLGAGLTLVSEDDLPASSEESWVTAGFGFAALGAVIAGIIGFQEQWGDVELDVGASATAAAKPAVRAAVTF